MASVTQCDCCGDVVKHEESFLITINSMTEKKAKGALNLQKEICKKCFQKVEEILKKGAKK